MDKKKANLLEALVRRGIAKIKISIIDGNMKDHMDEFKDIYVEIIKLSEPTDSKVRVIVYLYTYFMHTLCILYACLRNII